MGEKELGTVGLDNVWKKVFGLTKLITGNVDVKQKGNLQTQINNIQVNINKVFGNEDNPDGEIGFVEGIEADNIIDAINEVFQIGNEKKNKLVENLVAMGISASTEETWEELLNKVLDMTDTSDDTVTKAVLLENYTAHDASGAQITGDMPERASVTVDTTGVTQDSSYTYFGVPEGHYDKNSKVRAINSDIFNNFGTIHQYIAQGSAYNNAEVTASGSIALKKGDRYTVYVFGSTTNRVNSGTIKFNNAVIKNITSRQQFNGTANADGTLNVTYSCSRQGENSEYHTALILIITY